MKIEKKNSRHDPIKVCSTCFEVLLSDYKPNASRAYTCVECQTLKNKKNFKKRYAKAENKEKIQQQTKDYYYANRSDRLEKVRAYAKANPEKRRKSVNKRYKERLRTEPLFKLRHRVSCYMYQLLKGQQKKDTKKILASLGYTIADLKAHLEAQFVDGMAWENHGNGKGKWNIDHEKPVCSFLFNSIEDDSFRECWKLTNLRPLWHHENLAKISSDKKQSLRRLIQ